MVTLEVIGYTYAQLCRQLNYTKLPAYCVSLSTMPDTPKLEITCDCVETVNLFLKEIADNEEK